MTRPRVRDVVLVAVAAVITSGLSAFEATALDPEPEPQAAQASASEESEPNGGDGDAKPKHEVVKPPPPKQAKPARGGNQGNGHGKTVSAAARGVTPPVGDCRNRGHWVSTVAKGLASCDDNPRPPAGQSPGRAAGRGRR